MLDEHTSSSAHWTCGYVRGGVWKAHHDDQIIQHDQAEHVVPLPGRLLRGVLRHKLIQPGHQGNARCSDGRGKLPQARSHACTGRSSKDGEGRRGGTVRDALLALPRELLAQISHQPNRAGSTLLRAGGSRASAARRRHIAAGEGQRPRHGRKMLARLTAGPSAHRGGLDNGSKTDRAVVHASRAEQRRRARIHKRSSGVPGGAERRTIRRSLRAAGCAPAGRSARAGAGRPATESDPQSEPQSALTAASQYSTIIDLSTTVRYSL